MAFHCGGGHHPVDLLFPCFCFAAVVLSRPPLFFLTRRFFMRVSPVLHEALRRRHPTINLPTTATAPGQPFFARVLSVQDGDGFTVRQGRHLQQIRLYGIDAPEHGQPGSHNSWVFLQSLLWSESIYCVPLGRCPYGRLICDCYGGSRFSVSLLMTWRGHAWHYRRFAPSDTALRDAERLARLNSSGLWRAHNPVPPWIWRALVKSGRSFSHG